MVDDLENPRMVMKTYNDKIFGFETALKLLKHGYRVHRKGWNGTGMYAVYLQGNPERPIQPELAAVTRIEEGTPVGFAPHLMLKTASVVAEFVPWVPSQTDLLAEDWMISF